MHQPPGSRRIPRVPRVRLIALLLSLIAIAAAGSALRVHAMNRYLDAQSPEDVYYLPPPEWLKVLSLGHYEALASALYPRALVYFGEGFANKTHASHVFDYADAMIHLDPEFKRIYRFISMTALYRMVPPTPEERERVAEYVREGARRFPNDGDLAWNAGATLAYELSLHEEGEERERLIAEAQPYFARAVELGAAPPWMALGTASRLAGLGETERAIEQLLRVIPSVDDEEMREALIARLGELRAEAARDGMLYALENLHRAHQEEAPYVPFDFYLVLGERALIDDPLAALSSD